MSLDSVHRKKSFESFFKERYNDIATKYTFLSSQQIKKRVLDMWKKMPQVSGNSKESKKTNNNKWHSSNKQTIGTNNNSFLFTEEPRNSLRPSLKSKGLVPLKVVVLPAPVKGALKSEKKSTEDNRRVSFNSEPEIRYRTASETSSTSTYKSLHNQKKSEENSELFFNNKSNSRSYSHRSLKAKQNRETESETDKKFEDLLNEKCSWSYKTIKTFNCKAQRNNDPIFHIQSTIETVNTEESICNNNRYEGKTYSNEEFRTLDVGVRHENKSTKSSKIEHKFRDKKQNQTKYKIQKNENSYLKTNGKLRNAKVKTDSRMNRPRRNVNVVKYAETDEESQQSSSDDGIVLQSRICKVNNDQDESDDNFSDHKDYIEILQTNSLHKLNDDSKSFNYNLDRNSDNQMRTSLKENIDNGVYETASPQLSELVDNFHPEEGKQTNLSESFDENKITEITTNIPTPDSMDELINKNPEENEMQKNNEILKNKDFESQILQKYLSVSSEVQSICNELETSQRTIEDEIMDDFFNGTFDIEKYKSKNLNSKIISQNEHSNTNASDNCTIKFNDEKIVESDNSLLKYPTPDIKLMTDKRTFRSQDEKTTKRGNILNMKNKSNKRKTLKKKSQKMNEKSKFVSKNTKKIGNCLTENKKLFRNYRDPPLKKEDESMEFSKDKAPFKKKNPHSKLNETLIQPRYSKGNFDVEFDQIQEKNKGQKTTGARKINKTRTDRSISGTSDPLKEIETSSYIFSETDLLRESEFDTNFVDETEMNSTTSNENKHNIKNESLKKGSLKCNDYEKVPFSTDYHEILDSFSKNKLQPHTKSKKREKNNSLYMMENNTLVSKKPGTFKTTKTRSLSTENEIKQDFIKHAEFDFTKESKKGNPKTWEDLEAEILAHDEISPSLDVMHFTSQEQLLQDVKSKKLKKNLKRNLENLTDCSDNKNISSDNSLNIQTFQQEDTSSITESESISPKITFNSPNANIIEKVIMKMQQCTSPLSLSSKTKEEYIRSPFLTEYSYSIQETQSMNIMTEKRNKNSNICTIKGHVSLETSVKFNKPQSKPKNTSKTKIGCKKLNKIPDAEKNNLSEFQFDNDDVSNINESFELERKTSKSSSLSSSQNTISSNAETRYNLRKRKHSNTSEKEGRSITKNKYRTIRSKDNISRINHCKSHKTKHNELSANGETMKTFENEMEDKDVERFLTEEKNELSLINKRKFKSRNARASSNDINELPDEDTFNVADGIDLIEDSFQEVEENYYNQNKDSEKSNTEDGIQMPSNNNEILILNNLKEIKRDIKTQNTVEIVKEPNQNFKMPKYNMKEIENNVTSIKQGKGKKNSKEEYEKYLKKIFSNNILETSEVNQKCPNTSNNLENDHEKQAFNREISHKMLIADSDEELSSLSSFDTDFEEIEQTSQKRATGLLDDLFD
ncbi:uncharacterized protein NPIL_331671 [Nephila pilipes]|uniref:Uncharacterized protein n=1 Tax=Nephila pilipes TaxID=299642 RepID=A0A8X6P9Q4_NEPPI|nr:uncharacterized protein NPIL_331671 [Nephila pilipes]